MIDQWQAMKFLANTVSRELFRDRVTMLISQNLDRLSNVVQWYSRRTDRDRLIQGFLCPLDQSHTGLVHIAN